MIYRQLRREPFTLPSTLYIVKVFYIYSHIKGEIVVKTLIRYKSFYNYFTYLLGIEVKIRDCKMNIST